MKSENSVDELRITEWLKPDSTCGQTGFDKCTTNRGWLVNEVKRLKDKGVRAVVVNHGGMSAIFRTKAEETAFDIERELTESENSEKKGGSHEEAREKAGGQGRREEARQEVR